MKDFVFKTFIQLITFGYERIFHEKMSDEVKKFFKNLSYVGFGTVIATIFSFTFNILAGRILGPSGYGEFTLVQSVAMFLYIPMLLGFNTAMVKYNAEEENYNRQRSIISTTYILVFICTIVLIFVYYLFSSQISNLFSVPREIFYLSVGFAVLFVFYTLTTNTLRGLHEMKKYAIFQPIYGVILLLPFLVFVFLNFLSFKSAVFSMYLAYGITGGIILAFIRKYLRFAFDKHWANKLARYGGYAIIGGVSYVFHTNIDKILINTYMTVADVGIYRAYYFASINVAGLSFGIFNTVFFPTASKYQDKGAIFNRINKLRPYLIGLGVPFVFLCEFVILKLYGSQYPINPPLMTLFAVASICVVVDGLYGWLLNSVGWKGAKITSFATLIAAIMNVLANILLIPLIGIGGAITATILTYLLATFIKLRYRSILGAKYENRIEIARWYELPLLLLAIFCEFRGVYRSRARFALGLLMEAASHVLRRHTKFYTLKTGGKLCGVIVACSSAGESYLTHFTIFPKYRGKGLGKILLKGVINQLFDNGTKIIRLQVAEDNLPALNLYKKGGFIVIDRYKSWRGEGCDQLLLEKYASIEGRENKC